MTLDRLLYSAMHRAHSTAMHMEFISFKMATDCSSNSTTLADHYSPDSTITLNTLTNMSTGSKYNDTLSRRSRVTRSVQLDKPSLLSKIRGTDEDRKTAWHELKEAISARLWNVSLQSAQNMTKVLQRYPNMIPKGLFASQDAFETVQSALATGHQYSWDELEQHLKVDDFEKKITEATRTAALTMVSADAENMVRRLWKDMKASPEKDADDDHLLVSAEPILSTRGKGSIQFRTYVSGRSKSYFDQVSHRVPLSQDLFLPGDKLSRRMQQHPYNTSPPTTWERAVMPHDEGILRKMREASLEPPRSDMKSLMMEKYEDLRFDSRMARMDHEFTQKESAVSENSDETADEVNSHASGPRSFNTEDVPSRADTSTGILDISDAPYTEGSGITAGLWCPHSAVSAVGNSLRSLLRAPSTLFATAAAPLSVF